MKVRFAVPPKGLILGSQASQSCFSSDRLASGLISPASRWAVGCPGMGNLSGAAFAEQAGASPGSWGWACPTPNRPWRDCRHPAPTDPDPEENLWAVIPFSS